MTKQSHTLRAATIRATQSAFVVRRTVGALHVSAPNREVIAAIRSKLRADTRKEAAHRNIRKAMYRLALKVHAHNRDVFIRVMSGNI